WRGYLFMELFGTKGSLLINYDDASCTLARRGGEGTVHQFAGMPDRSWEREIEELMAAACEGREPLANGHDGWQAVRIARAVSQASERGRGFPLCLGGVSPSPPSSSSPASGCGGSRASAP